MKSPSANKFGLTQPQIALLGKVLPNAEVKVNSTSTDPQEISDAWASIATKVQMSATESKMWRDGAYSIESYISNN